jgi:hypothetical protein
MITETTIDAQVTDLEASDFDADLAAFSRAQPFLMDYLSGEDTGAFTEAEQELLFFAALVLHHSVEEVHGKLDIIVGDKIAAAEEDIFEILGEQQSRVFRDRLTVFFDQTKEEDLLAFIEDLLISEEDTNVTKEGREPLFVILKTCMDVMLKEAG